MASWFSSLETVLRLHSVMSWLTILAAFAAVASGVFAYILSNQASALRERAAEEQLQTALQATREDRAELENQANQAEQRRQGLAQEVEELEAALEDSRLQAQQAGEEAEAARRQRDAERRRANAALDDASQKQAALQRALSEPEDLKSARRTEAAQQGALSQRQREKLLRALSDKPSGEVTLVAVAGDADSNSLAKGLQEALTEAGWTVAFRQGQFTSKPQGLYFVVHSQESMPQYTLQLAVGLAVIDLMPMPAKIRVNAKKPPGSLAIVVGSVQP
ncbi:MAG: hypothetical protein V3T83_00605 [Acidobacteriota bacterium]